MRFVATAAVAVQPRPPVTLPPPNREPLTFHRRLPGYAPTPLVNAPSLARRLGVEQVLVKDESCRLGLPSFKILGASWAVYRAIRDRLGLALPPWQTVDDLRVQLLPLGGMVLVTATDGNHGRAVARVATWFGCSARVFIPLGTVRARIDAIQAEGAEVTIVDGSYDEAVALAATQSTAPRTLVIADTAQSEADAAAGWVIEGSSTIFFEVEDALARTGQSDPDVLAVQVGVGALAAPAVQHYRGPNLAGEQRPRIVGVEPERAACLLASMEAGRLISLSGVQDSIMAGLNWGTPSPVAWPLISRGMDLHLAIEDEYSRQAMRALAVEGVVSGESGAAGLGGLLALVDGWGAAPELRAIVGLNGSARVLLLSTEGATDGLAYEQIVGRSPASVVAQTA